MILPLPEDYNLYEVHEEWQFIEYDEKHKRWFWTKEAIELFEKVISLNNGKEIKNE